MGTYKIYQRTENGNIFIASMQENIEDNEIYVIFKDGEAKVFEPGEFYNIYKMPIFMLEPKNH